MELLQVFRHPEEVMALLKWKLWGTQKWMPKCDFMNMSPSLNSCYDLLNKNKNTQIMIQTLDHELRNGVCIFYLVLRALDTVEDDMTIPLDVKIPMLKSFYKNLLDPDWKYTRSKDKDKIVLEQFPAISKEFRALDKKYQEIISDVCQEMGEGMSEFLVKTVDTLEDWDKYGHYVAGLVGMGLAQFFSASGLEDPFVGQSFQLAERMGIISQKTDHIQDFLEDFNNNRIFWPKSIWSKYVNDIRDLTKVENEDKAVQCLNELIVNALELIPSCLQFLAMLQSRGTFTATAIHQVVAIATLERCYNNPNIFTGRVRIRMGEAVRILMESTSMEKVKAIMKHYTLRIIDKIPSDDPNSAKTCAICQKILKMTDTQQEDTTSSFYPALYVSLGLALTAISYTYWSA